MPTTDPRMDAYIKNAEPFAQPILTHLRKLVHTVCPQVTETIKWGFPHFEYAGEILGSMASFKQHCVFGFWKAPLLKDPDGILEIAERGAMGHLGRITSLKDLPKDSLLKNFIKQAVQLNEQGVKNTQRTFKPATAKTVEVPAALLKALKKNKAAYAFFEKITASQKKEYIEWITEAKTEPTKEKRMATALEWLAEGKTRNWKYQK